MVRNTNGNGKKLVVRPHFVEEGRTPEQYFDWGTRDVQIKNKLSGEII